MDFSIDPVELTHTLVGFNTINPPGNERHCAEHLGALLEEGGFSVSYHEFADKRTNLIARIGGSPDKSPFVLPGMLTQFPWAPHHGPSTRSPVKFPTASFMAGDPPT